MNKSDLRRLHRAQNPEDVANLFLRAGMTISSEEAEEIFNQYCLDNKFIRLATEDDLPEIFSILSNARKFMKENGNPDQWGDSWPSEEIIKDDVKKKQSYVVYDVKGNILATYAYIEGEDPTYLNIWDGKWLTDKPYGTIHRIASSGKVGDVFSFIVKEISKNGLNIRIDTHEKNSFMLHQLKKNGFVRCGLISPINGGIRLAFEKVVSE